LSFPNHFNKRRAIAFGIRIEPCKYKTTRKRINAGNYPPTQVSFVLITDFIPPPSSLVFMCVIRGVMVGAVGGIIGGVISDL